MKKIKFVILVFLSLTIQGWAMAQDWVSYQSQKGINDLVDKGNELYLATSNGLVVMNKTTLEKTIFNKANSNLTNNHIQTITEAPNGDIWIGTYDVKIARFDGSNFQDAFFPNDPSFVAGSTNLYNLEIAPNGDFWMGTTRGIFQKQGTNYNHYDQAALGSSFFEPWDLIIDDLGTVFVASIDVHKFEGGVWTNITSSTNIENYLDADFFFSSTGDLYMAGDLSKIGKYDGTTWEELDFSAVLSNGSEIKGLTEDENGDIYFYSLYDGIYKLTSGNWVKYINSQTTASNDKTTLFYIDAQGKEWHNYNIHLSVNYNGSLSSTLLGPNTLESDAILKIQKGADGTMFFLNNSVLSSLDLNDDWSYLALPSNLQAFESIRDIYYVSSNEILLTTNFGLHKFSNNQWSFDNLGALRYIFADSQGKIYINSDNAIYVFNNGVMSEINAGNSSLSPSLSYIAGIGVDANNKLWIACGGQNLIQTLDADGTWTNYDDLAYPAIDAPVGEFHFDVNGNVWIPSDAVGAIRFDGTDFFNPYTGNLGQMANYEVQSIESDEDGKLYFSHQYGVTTYLDGQFEDLLIEDVPNVFNSSSSGVKFDDFGRLWWGSSRYGVFAYGEKTISSIFSKESKELAFSFYPNPVQSSLNLSFTAENKGEASLAVYNTLGQQVYSKNLGQIQTGSFEQQLDLSHLEIGFYLIQVKLNNQVASGSIVKKN